MSEENLRPEKKLLKIRKYQNRRYYDTTQSTHLSLEEIHRKICDGYEISVVDAKTETDITVRVLAQILLEYEPLKLEFFSPGLLSQVIRVNDSMLKDFFDLYFSKAFSLFQNSKSHFEELLRSSHMLPNYLSGNSATPITSAMESFNPFTSIFTQQRSKKAEDNLTQQLEDLKKQVEALQSTANKGKDQKA